MGYFVGWTFDDEGTLYKPNGKPCSFNLCSEGYRRVYYEGKRYKQHRIIFFLVNGWWPEEVDHIDRNRANNRPSNLRGTDKSGNQHNKRMLDSNTSGIRGVSKRKRGGWVAHISIGGKSIQRQFKTKDSAILQRQQWEQLYGLSSL
jgi:hypothetical protein